MQITVKAEDGNDTRLMDGVTIQTKKYKHLSNNIVGLNLHDISTPKIFTKVNKTS